MTSTLRYLTPVRDDGSRADLGLAVRDSIKAMHWLTPADQALSALAVLLADQIEVTDEPMDVSRLTGQLLAALRDLGGTPGARSALGPTQQTGGKLAQLRATSNAAG